MFKRRGRLSNDLTNNVIDITARLMREQGIQGTPDLKASLAEDGLGFDSMGRLTLLSTIEKELGVSIPEAYWGSKRFKNLRDVIRVVSKHRA